MGGKGDVRFLGSRTDASLGGLGEEILGRCMRLCMYKQ